MTTHAKAAQTLRKPALPPEFYGPSFLGGAGLIGFMLVTFIGPAIASYYVIMHTALAWWAKLAICLPLSVLAGNAFHLMGFIGHDGFHFCLHRNRLVSALLGLFFSSMTVAFFQIGMALDHWTHHKLTNTEHDPDLQLLRHYRSFAARFFLQRFRANRKYFKRACMLASRREIPAELCRIRNPLDRDTMRYLAWLNFAFAAMWLAAYLVIDSVLPGMFVIGYLVPALIGSWLSGIRSFVEHNETGTGPFADTRSRVSPVFTVLHYGGNFHLEHHLYPSVPQWRLPKVHRFLKEQGVFEQLADPSLLETGIFSGYRFATSRYSYGRLRADEPSAGAAQTLPTRA